MATNATTRRRRTAAGKCSVCLRRRRTSGFATCDDCRTAIAAYSAELYARARKAGLCTRSGCGEPADGALCAAHAEERNARRRKRDWR